MSLQSWLTLCNPRDCSLPGSPVHGIFQASILEWVTISAAKGSSPPRDRTCVSYVSCTGKRFFTTSTTWEASSSWYQNCSLFYSVNSWHSVWLKWMWYNYVCACVGTYMHVVYKLHVYDKKSENNYWKAEFTLKLVSSKLLFLDIPSF